MYVGKIILQTYQKTLKKIVRNKKSIDVFVNKCGGLIATRIMLVPLIATLLQTI